LRRVRILLLVLILIISVTSISIAEGAIESGELKIENQGQGQENKELGIEEYWELLKKRADELYGKADLSVEISTSVYSDGDYSGEAKVKVPIFDSAKRKQIKKDKMTFLDKGAKLLNELEVNLNSLQILREQEVYFKALITSNGASSIKDYYRVKEDLIEMRAKVNEVRRKLGVMVM